MRLGAKWHAGVFGRTAPEERELKAINSMDLQIETKRFCSI
jgi:hypothetical protein